MKSLILSVFLFGCINGLMSNFHHTLQKRQADMIEFSEQCTAVFATIDLTCMDNIYKLVNAYKNVEKAAIDRWTNQCTDNVFDCVTSHDGETAELIRYFKTMLPMIKKLCADGCMVGIIDLIHNCLKQDALDELGLTRFETEAIFDLVCIQEDDQENGKEGEYCMIKAMTTASFLYEANKVQNCNLDSIDLTNLSGTCPDTCSQIISSANTLMGCCMGTLLLIEKTLNLPHPDQTDLMNPGGVLFEYCGVTVGAPCKSSKQQVAQQQQQYAYCYNALEANTKSDCVQLEDDLHTRYLAEMQNIGKTCQKTKNINQCKNSTAKIPISEELMATITKLNDHCSECSAELLGIRQNCTVFLPEEAKMIFEMMCLKNSDLQHCGPTIITYEAEQGRSDLNSNPCFKGYMPLTSKSCSEECAAEIQLMNKANVLSCFDALMDFTLSPSPMWQLWHKTCVKDTTILVNNKIDVSAQIEFAKSSEKKSSSSSTLKTVVITFVGTLFIALLVVAVVVVIYKRQMLMGMFGYNKFTGDQHLISDVHMADTLDHDNGENYYD